MTMEKYTGSEPDNQGFPSYPELIESKGTLRQLRLLQAQAHDRIFGARWGDEVDPDDERAKRLLDSFSDPQDTLDLISARLAAKFIKNEEEDSAAFGYDQRFGESVFFGIHWTCFPEGTDGLQIALYIFGDTEDGLDWSEQVIVKERISDDFTLSREEIELLEICADRKTYLVVS